MNSLATAGLDGGGAARTTGAGRAAGGARIPELPPAVDFPPALPNGLK